MTNLYPLSQAANTVAISTSATSVNAALPQESDGTINKALITVEGSKAYIKIGDNTVSASTTDLPIGIGQQVISIATGKTHIAAISPDGAGTVEITLVYGA